ncbi:hypothetical protein D3C73_834860 [compost metagenome]
MVHSIKEFLQVHVYDPPVTFLNVGFRLFYCVVGSFPRAEAEAVWREFWVKDWRHHLHKGLLDEAIHYGRDT